jgi:PIN domain nuclease of toxin-antitoxin system
MERVGVKYLMDTAPWINATTLPQSVPRHILELLETNGQIGLCSVSLLEAAILHRLGRLQLRGTLPEFFMAAMASNLHLLELTPAIAAKTNELSADFQGDPFDRTIAATAAILHLTLITTDATIRDAKVCEVEYYPFRLSRAQM